MENINNLYDTDYHQWVEQQKQLLQSGQLDRLDIKNLLEELGEVGKQNQHALESHLINLILHLLKHQYQTQVINPQRYEPQEFRSWYDSIDTARRETRRLMKKNPSLRSRMAEVITDSYPDAKAGAINQMNKYLPKDQRLTDQSFPAECPWSYDQLIDDDWLP